MNPQSMTNPEKDRASTRRDDVELRSKTERRTKSDDRRQANVPVVIERRNADDRRAASDRREFERRSGRDRRNDPWPA